MVFPKLLNDNRQSGMLYFTERGENHLDKHTNSWTGAREVVCLIRASGDYYQGGNLGKNELIYVKKNLHHSDKDIIGKKNNLNE